MLWFALLLLLIQLGFTYWIQRGLKKIVQSPASNSTKHSFSVIIAAHNEEFGIAELLQRLCEQTYPPGKFEVILAADRCTDQTISIAKRFSQQLNLTVLDIQDVPLKVSPKKNALEQAIKIAAHDRLLFLDADVLPTQQHIEVYNCHFAVDVNAVVGIMAFNPAQSFWQRFIVFEKLVSWCIAAAGIASGQAIISYGGNWGYTRKAFDTIDGFDDIRTSLSGDDDLLLQRFSRLPGRIAFCLDTNGWITMDYPKTFGEFLRQRRRHFSAGKRYQPLIQFGYLMYHLSNLLLWLLWIIYPPAVFALLIKLLADSIALYKGGVVFNRKQHAFTLPIFLLLYLLYNSLIGPLGHLGKIRW
ncbi:MAG: glycosyltransferase [Calditrichia bacterium]